MFYRVISKVDSQTKDSIGNMMSNSNYFHLICLDWMNAKTNN